MAVVVTAWIGEREESFVLKRKGKITRQFSRVISVFVKNGCKKLEMGNAVFLTDGESSYKVEIV